MENMDEKFFGRIAFLEVRLESLAVTLVDGTKFEVKGKLDQKNSNYFVIYYAGVEKDEGDIIVRKIILNVLSIAIILMLIGCEEKPTIRGTYQSEIVNGYYIQMAIQQSMQADDSTFVKYIDNREVDRGTYEQIENNTYKMKGENQNFEITLKDDNSFEIVIKKLNFGNPIKMIKLDDVPSYSSTIFDDVDEYKALLD